MTALNLFVFMVAVALIIQLLGGDLLFLLLLCLFLVYKGFSVLTGTQIVNFTNDPDERERFYCLNLKLEIGLRNVVVLAMIIVFLFSYGVFPSQWCYLLLGQVLTY